jgi:hypothetical protein
VLQLKPGRDVKEVARTSGGTSAALSTTEAKLCQVNFYIYVWACCATSTTSVFLFQELLKRAGKEANDEKCTLAGGGDQVAEGLDTEATGTNGGAPVGGGAAAATEMDVALTACAENFEFDRTESVAPRPTPSRMKTGPKPTATGPR